MNKLFYDLHIHSCLSPCGDEDMTPANIVGMAMVKNLDVIAVTDHNSCKNCTAVLQLAKKNNIIAIPGMELCTMEEVHVLCLFECLEDALLFDNFVYNRLNKIMNKESIFGKQEIYNEMDDKIGEEPYLLINASTISIDELEDLMKQFHGIFIPSHIDKNSNSIISNLGFVPPDSKFRCYEIHDRTRMDQIKKSNPYLEQCQVIYNSDAHNLWEINEALHSIEAEEPSIKSILKALINK